MVVVHFTIATCECEWYGCDCVRMLLRVEHTPTDEFFISSRSADVDVERSECAVLLCKLINRTLGASDVMKWKRNGTERSIIVIDFLLSTVDDSARNQLARVFAFEKTVEWIYGEDLVRFHGWEQHQPAHLSHVASATCRLGSFHTFNSLQKPIPSEFASRIRSFFDPKKVETVYPQNSRFVIVHTHQLWSVIL